MNSSECSHQRSVLYFNGTVSFTSMALMRRDGTLERDQLGHEESPAEIFHGRYKMPT